MLRSLILIAFVVLAGQMSAFGQEKDSTRYINGLPVSEDDTVQQFLPGDLEPKSKLMEVPPEALPSAILKVLNEQEQYRGWRDSTVYFESNTRLYIIPVRSRDGVTIYGLNEDGKPVTFDVTSPPK